MKVVNFNRIWDKLGKNPSSRIKTIITNNADKYHIAGGHHFVHRDAQNNQLRMYRYGEYDCYVDIEQIEEILTLPDAAWPQPTLTVAYTVTDPDGNAVAAQADGSWNLTDGLAYALNASTSAVKTDVTISPLSYAYLWNFGGLQADVATAAASVTMPAANADNRREGWTWYLTVSESGHTLIRTAKITVKAVSA